MTIISRPATPTFIVSTPGAADLVRSVHGRIGNVVAQDDDYDITQINPSGANDDDVIAVESGRFVIKTPVISGEAILQTIPATGDILEFNGTNWTVTQPKISGNFVQAAGPEAGEVLTFDGSNWANFDIIALIGNSIVNNIAAHAILTDSVHGLTTVGPGTNFLADDGLYKTVTHPPDAISSIFGRTGIVVAADNDYTLPQIFGLTDAGSGTDFLAADGTYKPITHPPDAVTSVFGRTDVVIAVSGDYAIADITGLITAGPGTNALFDDGTYKSIVHPPDAVDSVFGRTGTVASANNDYTLPQIDGLIDSGSGNSFLADDGTYKAIARRQIVAPSIADGTTITSAFQTVFDFSPDAAFRNNNCLITIHYQAMNVGGPATWGVHLRSLIGFTVQQNAYGAGVAQDVNSDERATFTATMEAVISATGNIQIQSFAEIRDHDLANNAANGKTRLVIELV